MRKIYCLFIILSIATFSIQLKAINYSNDPKTFVSELVNDAINILSDKDLNLQDKQMKIEQIATENVDIKALGLYTLGEKRKSLGKEQMAKYQNLFKKYFLKSLTSRLTDYANQNFEVLGADQKSITYTIVKSKMTGSDQPEIKIEWRIYTKNPDKPLIRDLIVEGLSLARTQKEEFASVLSANDNDINALFSQLENFISN